MTGILDIPQELLDFVTEFLLPHSLVPFVLSCKTIYTRCKPIIDRHNAYAKWNSMEIDALCVLVEIARDPNIGLYIESLHLRDMRSDWEEWIAEMRSRVDPDADPDEEPDLEYDQTLMDVASDEEKMKRLEEMVLQCRFLEEAGIDAEQWNDQLRLENDFTNDGTSEERFEWPAITIFTLLLHLPNLKELGLPRNWTYIGDGLRDEVELWPGKVLRKMVECARDPASSTLRPIPGDRPLAKLETLMPYQDTGYEQRTGLQVIEPFLPLPNLQNVYSTSGIAAIDGYTGIPFNWQPHHAHIGIALRRLEISHGCCNAKGISTLLSNTPHLEVFAYSHETKWHGCEHDWDANAFVGAIASCVGPTLKQLVVRIDTLYGFLQSSVQGFYGFDTLEELEVDVKVLTGGAGSGFPQGQLYDMLERNARIKKVLLNLETAEAGLLGERVRGFKNYAAARCPTLEAVIVRVKSADDTNLENVRTTRGDMTYEAYLDMIRELVEAEGMTWKMVSPQKYVDMGWKRRFNERVYGAEDVEESETD